MLINNNDGFSLLEMMVVLIITATAMYGFSVNFINYLEATAIDQSITMIESSYNSAKSHAITNKEDVSLVIDNKTHEVYVKANQKVVYTYQYSCRVTITSNVSNEIKLNQRGNIKSAQTLTFKTKHQERIITFSIGSGGIDVK